MGVMICVSTIEKKSEVSNNFKLQFEYLKFFFFFQAEDGIRDIGVTGVQTCALPISLLKKDPSAPHASQARRGPLQRGRSSTSPWDPRRRLERCRPVRTRRGTVLGSTFTLLAVAVLAACSGSAEDDVRAAGEAFLGDWSAGDTAAAAGATTDPEAATALLEQTATDLPGAALTPEVGQVTVEDGTATVDWTATWDLAAAPDWSYPATLRLQEAEEGWDVVPEPALVHPELGEGQRLLLERELPERAAITDAAGQPLFTPTEVVNVGVDPAQVTDLPALAAGLASATGVRSEEIVADVQAAPAGQFVPVITLRRPDFEAVRAQVFDLPGAVFPTDTRLLAPSPRFASALDRKSVV